MFVAELIGPSSVQGKIGCKNCDLNYPKEHYEILLDNKKLAYFKINNLFYDTKMDFDPTCMCHGCLFKLLKHISEVYGGEKVKMKLIYKSQDFYMSYDPQDPSSLW